MNVEYKINTPISAEHRPVDDREGMVENSNLMVSGRR